MGGRSGEDQPGALVSPDRLQQLLRDLADAHLPDPERWEMRPQFFIIAPDPADPSDRKIETFDLDWAAERGESARAIHFHSIGRIAAQSRRCIVAAFLLWETGAWLSRASDIWLMPQTLAESAPAAGGLRRVAMLLGMSIDGNCCGGSALVERATSGALTYCSETTLWPDVREASPGAELIHYLDEFWRGFMEVVIDQGCDPGPDRRE